MTEEERIFAGKLFSPGDEKLRAIKLKAHNLSSRYNTTFEDEAEIRATILAELFHEFGPHSFIQGPIYIHYGTHTSIGDHFFANFNLTIQDDALVSIGSHCNFGTGVSLVTAMHPLLAEEREALVCSDGSTHALCYAKPIHIGNNCWFGANVTVCPGVTIGSNCVIGAGSVVTRDIPDNTLAVGVPCKVVRALTDADRLPDELRNSY